MKLNFPHLEVWQMAETCALRAAARGGLSLEQVGRLTNLAQERVSQIEEPAMALLKIGMRRPVEVEGASR